MTNLDRLLEWAQSQLGTREQGGNNVIYNTDFYGRPVQGPEYPWCVTFLWDGFRVLGLSSLFCGGEWTAYCPYVANWAQTHGCWVSDGYRVGDLLLFDWDGDGVADHIGLCVAASGNYYATIEGNVDNQVSACTRFKSSIMGAYRPAYGDEDSQSSPAPDPAADGYMVQPGDSLWKIARDLLGDANRWPEIQQLNGLDSAVIYPGQVLRLPAENVSNSDHSPPPEVVAVDLPVLRQGVVGDVVSAVQALLQLRGYRLPVSGVDGELGPETTTALRALQQDYHLPVTGQTDAATWRTLLFG